MIAFLFYLIVLNPIWNLLLNHFQLEAIGFLREIVMAERAYYQGSDYWSEDFGEVAVDVSRHTRYAFFLSPESHTGKPLSELGLKLPVDFKSLGAPTPGLTDAGFIAVAVGNIDLDDELDVWWVDQSGRMRNPHSDVFVAWKKILQIFGVS